MIYIYLLSVFALLPVIAYILSQKTSNKGYVFGFSLIVVLICLFVFVGKFSFLGTLQEQAFNDEILSYIDEDQLISSEVINSFEETIEDNEKINWMQAYITQAISSKKFQAAESLISYSEQYFNSPEEKFIFYSLYTDLRDSKFPAFANSKLIVEFEQPSECKNVNGMIELFIMNGPNIPIAKLDFINFLPVTLSNNNSSIPGFDLASAYLNQETVDMKVLLKCNDFSKSYSAETSLLFDQNSPINRYKIGLNEWLKK